MKNRRLLQTTITKTADEVENYVGIPLTDEQRRSLQALVDLAPIPNVEDVAAFALEVGVNQLLGDEDRLEDVSHARNEHELSIGNDEPTAREQMFLLARAFEMRDELKTPSSITVSLSTMDRYAVDQLVAASGMKLDEVAKMIVAKGIAAL